MKSSSHSFTPHTRYSAHLLSPSSPQHQSDMPGRTSPLEKFGQAVAKCSVEVSLNLRMAYDMLMWQQSAAYGKCVVAEYQNVRKDMCVQEFMRLKNCYLV